MRILICRNCSFNDGMVSTSNSPKYKCIFNNECYNGFHLCHFDLIPVIRCKNCSLFIPVDKLKNSHFDYCYDYCKDFKFDGLCENTGVGVMNNDYCSDGEEISLDKEIKE